MLNRDQDNRELLRQCYCCGEWLGDESKQVASEITQGIRDATLYTITSGLCSPCLESERERFKKEAEELKQQRAIEAIKKLGLPSNS